MTNKGWVTVGVDSNNTQHISNIIEKPITVVSGVPAINGEGYMERYFSKEQWACEYSLSNVP